jgi:hypothetical protein
MKRMYKGLGGLVSRLAGGRQAGRTQETRVTRVTQGTPGTQVTHRHNSPRTKMIRQGTKERQGLKYQTHTGHATSNS